MGKLIAEHAFAEAAEQHGFWEAITCCPGDNVGPILAPHQKDRGPWQRHIQEMLLGVDMNKHGFIGHGIRSTCEMMQPAMLVYWKVLR